MGRLDISLLHFALILTICRSSIVQKQFVNILSNQHLFTGLQILRNMSASTQLKCAVECMRYVECQGFSYNNAICLVLDSQSLGANPYIYEATSILYMKWNSDFELLAFRVSAGLGSDPYEVYTAPQSSPLSDISTATQLTIPHSSVYKHPVLDNWSILDIKEVSIVIVPAFGEQMEIKFDATSAADKMEWMVLSNIISNPWIDLVATSPTVHFGIRGPTNVERYFYVIRNHGGCNADAGWFMLLGQSDDCAWSMNWPSYPAILYSLKTNLVSLEADRGNVGAAKDMLLVLKAQIKP